ncbi:hypothetical protein [Streptomyces nogalater]|uniref:Mce-associated membrane protein n=1 Tax=Streptomyces nogalater TaxID=38314 RepID=A0ABW0WBX7_STRNO
MRLTRPRRASTPALTRPAPTGPEADSGPEPVTPRGESTEPAADGRPEGGRREGEPAGAETDPGSESGAPGDGAGPPEAGGGVSGRSPGGRLRRIATAGIVAVLVGGGCGFHYGAHQLRSTEAARNRALTDTEATARVAGEIDNALARVFSYTPDGTATAERSARTLLDGRAARQYRDLFAQVRDDLAGQRITLSTKAVRTGVIELDGEHARLLVFLDQTSRRGDHTPTTAAAQLTVAARLVNDRWRIVDLNAR